LDIIRLSYAELMQEQTFGDEEEQKIEEDENKVE
jgi:hypothetical protein